MLEAPHRIQHDQVLLVAMILPATGLGHVVAASDLARHGTGDCVPRQPDSRSPG